MFLQSRISEYSESISLPYYESKKTILQNPTIRTSMARRPPPDPESEADRKAKIVIVLGNGSDNPNAIRFRRLVKSGWTVPESDEQAVE
jgi:hypothetical protein